MTAEVTGLPSLLPLNKQRIIKSKVKIRAPVHPMSVFCKKKGCLFIGKNQRFIKIRVLFWPEISALGVFFNFDNERMHPPKYPSAVTDHATCATTHQILSATNAHTTS